jgi:hypothetical protein
VAADAVISLFGLTLFACLFYGPWQAVCTDWARQIVFEKRDRLFDLAADGRLQFSSDEYRLLRSGFEGMIRFAHELTWPRLLFYAKLRHRMGIADDHSLAQATARIEDAEAREQVNELVFEATIVLIVMMALKSIFVAPIAFVAGCLAMCSTGFKYLISNSAVVLVRNSAIGRNLSETIQAEARLA